MVGKFYTGERVDGGKSFDTVECFRILDIVLRYICVNAFLQRR